jgi:hypothetical protein
MLCADEKAKRTVVKGLGEGRKWLKIVTQLEKGVVKTESTVNESERVSKDGSS